jgi:FtsZ-binding cell division protein ZapB
VKQNQGIQRQLIDELKVYRAEVEKLKRENAALDKAAKEAQATAVAAASITSAQALKSSSSLSHEDDATQTKSSTDANYDELRASTVFHRHPDFLAGPDTVVHGVSLWLMV